MFMKLFASYCALVMSIVVWVNLMPILGNFQRNSNGQSMDNVEALPNFINLLIFVPVLVYVALTLKKAFKK